MVVFVWARPRSLCCFAFSGDETHVWLGDLRVSCCVVLFLDWSLVIDLPSATGQLSLVWKFNTLWEHPLGKGEEPLFSC